MEKDDLNVTVVTRNGNTDLTTTIVAVAVYAGCLWLLVHPNDIERLKGKLLACANRLHYRMSVYLARTAIRRLPEVET